MAAENDGGGPWPLPRSFDQATAAQA